ncbi:citrate lyase subunit alpha [Mesoplasma whartonense]|uniref:citrate lyase subunit alpha n=1 Tax=Mesoplasma whartonense TaxID=2878854 RepID=UPI002022B6AF|nr:citrate lyase subunit alpha [Mesoplasma sp. JKS002660]
MKSMSKYVNEKRLSQKVLDSIKGLDYPLVAFDPEHEHVSQVSAAKKTLATHGIRRDKVVDLKTAIKNSGLSDGMTISFHHHLRGGDMVVNQVMQVIKELGIKDLTIAASSFTGAHDFLTSYMDEGIVSGVQTSGLRDKLGEYISSGKLKKPAIIRSHGGRPRAIEAGDLKIDVAFLAASSADEMGNANGSLGKAPFGSIGYALTDAQYAAQTIVITDTLLPFPNPEIALSQSLVDWVVVIDSIGDPSKIAGGAIRLTSSPKEEIIAQNIATVITSLPEFKDGFSIQMGTGGASLSSITPIKKAMLERNIKGGWCLGGITSYQVALLEEGLVQGLYDVQSFDAGAGQSVHKNLLTHHVISASQYANGQNGSPFVNRLDFVILSALEVDLNFNVNVITGSDGVIRGASGGHSDTAAAAKVAIVALPSIRGRLACVVDEVQTIITPGKSVDVVVTDLGVAINPLRTDLIEILSKTSLKLMSLAEMKNFAQQIVGTPELIEYDYNHPVAVVEYRDGSINDVIYKTKVNNE